MTQWTIIVDRSAPNSLALLQALQQAGHANLVGDDQMDVTDANTKAVELACTRYADAVLKAEQVE